jgi:ABC-type lipoprotein release transport system permease subunit
MLVVCANVANLMLGRAMSQQRDVAVRQSLGAPRSRILRLVMAKGLILSFIALIAAAVFVNWASTAIVRLQPPNT